MTQSVLVTGAAGFIGSHVCEALLGRGDRVFGLDNFDGLGRPRSELWWKFSDPKDAPLGECDVVFFATPSSSSSFENL